MLLDQASYIPFVSLLLSLFAEKPISKIEPVPSIDEYLLNELLFDLVTVILTFSSSPNINLS